MGSYIGAGVSALLAAIVAQSLYWLQNGRLLKDRPFWTARRFLKDARLTLSGVFLYDLAAGFVGAVLADRWLSSAVQASGNDPHPRVFSPLFAGIAAIISATVQESTLPKIEWLRPYLSSDVKKSFTQARSVTANSLSSDLRTRWAAVLDTPSSALLSMKRQASDAATSRVNSRSESRTAQSVLNICEKRRGDNAPFDAALNATTRKQYEKLIETMLEWEEFKVMRRALVLG